MCSRDVIDLATARTLRSRAAWLEISASDLRALTPHAAVMLLAHLDADPDDRACCCDARERLQCSVAGATAMLALRA